MRQRATRCEQRRCIYFLINLTGVKHSRGGGKKGGKKVPPPLPTPSIISLYFRPAIFLSFLYGADSSPFPPPAIIPSIILFRPRSENFALGPRRYHASPLKSESFKQLHPQRLLGSGTPRNGISLHSECSQQRRREEREQSSGTFNLVTIQLE